MLVIIVIECICIITYVTRAYKNIYKKVGNR